VNPNLLVAPLAPPSLLTATGGCMAPLWRWFGWLLLGLLSLAVAACGGGGGDGDTATVTIPSIASAPGSASVNAGQSVTFTVSAGGSGPLAYQWKKNDADVAGATAASYTFTATVADGGARFSVTVSNAAGSVTSAVATLTVNAAPVPPGIGSGPLATSVTEGQPAIFTVEATGTAPLTFQWRKNAVDIPGATAARYTTPATTLADDGALFSVVVTNAAGNAPSAAVALTVTPLPTPVAITTQPQASTVNEGQTATFSVAATGTAPLAYQWKKNGVDILGATLASYTTPALVLADSGTRYSVEVNNPVGPLASAEAVLTVSPLVIAPTITAQPQNVNVTAPNGASFSVSATGSTPLSYQWKKNGADIAGANASTLTLASTSTADSGAQFRVAVSNAAGTAISDPATLTVGAAAVPPSITANPATATVTAPATATFNVTVTGTPPFSYQWRRNGAAITGATGASYTTPATTVADNGALISVVVNNAAGSSAPSTDALLTVNAAPTPVAITTQPVDTTATAGQTASFSVVASGSGPLTYQWRKNGNPITGATSAGYTTPALTVADNSALYSVVVSNTIPTTVTSASARLTVAALVAPSITTQPADVSALNGSAVSFSVTASGTAPLAYQWRKNGTPITGATSAVYTIPAVSFYEDGAAYTVVVSNAASSSATSAAGTLTVTLPPSTVSQLSAGQYFSVALRSDGTVFSWQDWSSTQVDNYNAGVGLVSLPAGAAIRLKNADGTPVLNGLAVSAGTTHTALLRRDGTVWTWGYNSTESSGYCPIGDGACTSVAIPTQVKDPSGVPFTGVSSVAAGAYFNIALKTDGSVWAWGYNALGQLGTGNQVPTRNPVPVRAAAGGGLGGITAIAAGAEHALALKNDGTVLAWGENNVGQLGDGAPSTYSALPRQVETAPGVPLSGVIAVAAGQNHSVALRSDGSVYAWGFNANGALSDGTLTFRSRAVQVRDALGNVLSGITQIAAGAQVSIYLNSDGTVLAAGANDVGQLGDNTTATQQVNAVFVRDAANNVFTGVTSIASSWRHTLVKRSDGSVWAWGLNSSRQLGDTTNVNRRNPVAVPAGS